MGIINILQNKKIINKDLEEHYNTLATNVQFLGKDIKKIVISSVSENEGKSTVSINIARALANIGNKVLLIDADIRKSVMFSRFRYEGIVDGLSTYLSGLAEIQNIIYKTDIPNLMILPSGKVPPNAVSLLQSKHFDNMLELLDKYYDYIIIDTPPIGMVIDSAIIAKRSDGCILVTESGKIKRKFVKKAKEQLEQSGSKFLGVILNKLDVKTAEYGSYGSYGAYGSYGSYGKKKKN